MAEHRAARPEVGGTRQPTSLPGRILLAIGRWLRLLIATLLVSITLECIGIWLWWPELGVRHSEILLETDLAFVQASGASAGLNWLAESGRSVRSSSLYRTIERGWAKAMAAVHQLARRIGIEPERWTQGSESTTYLHAAKNTACLVLLRLVILILFFPTFLLLMAIGLVDGLVRRDLRRWGGGRESAYIFHHAKQGQRALLWLLAMIYLGLPLALPPALVVLPFAVAFAGSISLAASRFKKYL